MIANPVQLICLAAAALLLLPCIWMWQAWHRQKHLIARSAAMHAASRRLRAALAANGHGTYDADLVTGECSVSAEYARMLGHDPATFTESLERWRAGLHPDDVEPTLSALHACMRGEATEFSVEFRQARPDGSWRRILSQGTIVESTPEGRAARLVGTWTDVTQREESEAAHRARDERYRSQRDALVRMMSDEAAADEELPAAFSRIAELAAGTLRVARVSVWLYDEDRTAIRCAALYDDRAGTDHNGLVLHRSDYPAYFNALAGWNVIAADDAHGDARTAEFSASYLEPLGISSMLDASIHVGGAVVGVLCHEHIGPARHWTEDEKTFAVAVASVVSLALEGARRLRDEAEMRAQRDLLFQAHQALNSHLHNSPLAVVEWDPEYRVKQWSAHAERLFGWSADEVLMRTQRDWRFIHEDDIAVVEATMHALLGGTGGAKSCNRNYTKDGAVLHCEWYNSVLRDEAGRIVSLLSLVHDVTERVNAEAEQRAIEARLLQAQKLETVGRLAGGIAHDFNNLLTVINGSADLALDLHDPPDALRDDLRQIRDAGERAATLTRQLLAFSRKQILHFDVVDVNGMVARIEGMLKRLIGEHLQLIVALEPKAGNVRADAGQLEQVLLNLAVNARDAMPDGGTLTIRTGRLDIAPDDPRLRTHGQPGLQAGSHLLITVSDTGIGMDEVTRQRAFEPFYTTKGPEQGTGLGLAMVHGIVMQTGGAIWVESEPGRGTTFSVCLPRTDEPAADLEPHSPPTRVEGRGTILIVEDEPALNRLAARILSGAGYAVLRAADGVQALAVLHAHRGAVDLMLTDVVMPGMSGRDLAARVTADFPHVRVLFTSGYTDDEILRHGVLDHAAHFIGKPYTIDSLTSTIQTMLGADPHGSADTRSEPLVAAS